MRRAVPVVTLRKRPCGSCPYLRSTPVGIWAAEHFEATVRNDGDIMGPRYLCHLKDGDACVGWLADQKRRGVPNILQRLLLMQEPRERARLEAIDETSPRLYASIAEMVAANKDKPFPRHSRKALRLAQKVAAKK